MLDRRRPLAVVGDDDVAGGLVDPPERRHVDGRAVEDPALADAGLRRPAGLPGGQAVRTIADPTMQGGHVAGPQRPLEHGLGDPVQLDEHHTGYVGDVGRAGSPAGASGGGWSNQASSSRASRVLTIVVTAASPRATKIAVQKPSRCTPGRESSTRADDERFEDDGTEAERQHRDRDDDEGQRGPDDRHRRGRRPGRPAGRRAVDRSTSREAGRRRSTGSTAVTTVTTALRATTRDHDGRAAGRRRTVVATSVTIGARRRGHWLTVGHRPPGVHRARAGAGDRRGRRRPSPTANCSAGRCNHVRSVAHAG